MQNIASSITGCLCLRKNIKNIFKFHTIQTFIYTKKTKNDFCHESPSLRIKLWSIMAFYDLRYTISRENTLKTVITVDTVARLNVTRHNKNFPKHFKR